MTHHGTLIMYMLLKEHDMSYVNNHLACKTLTWHLGFYCRIEK